MVDQQQPAQENALLINEEALEYSHYLSRQRAQKEKEELEKEKEIRTQFHKAKSELVYKPEDEEVQDHEKIPEKRIKISDT